MDNVVSCGAEVSQEDVVFRNADYPSNQALFGQCKITVNAKPDICQLRLDFQEFVLSPPETCGPRAGFCVDDAFSVSAGVESASYPALCGQNSGQHSTYCGDASACFIAANFALHCAALLVPRHLCLLKVYFEVVFVVIIQAPKILFPQHYWL